MPIWETVCPRTWREIAQTIENGDPTLNPFTAFSAELSELQITESAALKWSVTRYDSMISNYSNDEIIFIFAMIHDKNRQKYKHLLDLYMLQYDPIANVDEHETYTETRTPNLSRESTGSGSSSSSIKNNQTRTTTETPNGYKTTAERQIDPSDGSGYRPESKTETTDTGSRATSESYSGDADTATASSSSTTTTTETGNETTTHIKSRTGNIGVTSTQQLIQQEIDILSIFDVLTVIMEDVAEYIFLQVWD